MATLIPIVAISCLSGTTETVPELVEKPSFPIPEKYLVVAKEITSANDTGSVFIHSVVYVAIANDEVIGDRTIERFRSSNQSAYRVGYSDCWYEAKIGELLPDSCK